MTSVAFKDVHDHAWNGYYAVPNESTTAWCEVLKDRKISRAAAICSSGEVGLFSILPHVQRELVLIDHSYKSLQVAALKYLLLKEKGARETYRLCTVASLEELRQSVAELQEKLPKQLRDKFGINGEVWLQPLTDRLPYADHASATGNPSVDHFAIKGEWKKIPPSVIEKAVKNLDRVRFLHGDLIDLVKDGPFGLLYISNALNHCGRERAGRQAYSPTPAVGKFQKIAAAVRPGGYVVLATTSYDGNRAPKALKWSLIKSLRPPSSSWQHQLWQLPKAATKRRVL